jgi:hypothetical protein
MMAALLNHVVSAIDAFLNVRAGESDVAGASRDLDLEFNVTDEGTGLTCTLVSRY